MNTKTKLGYFAEEVTNHASKDFKQLDRLYNFIVNHSYLPYLVLDRTFDAQLAFDEIRTVDDAGLFVEYFQKYGKTETVGWNATALYGISATHPWNAHSSISDSHKLSNTYNWTESAKLMPYFMSVVDDIVGIDNVNRCVCFRLDPGGYVDPHRDIPLSEGYKMLQVSFHIRWPDNVTWYMEDSPGGKMPTKDGTITIHSSVHEHAIINQGTEPRYFVWAFHKETDKFKQLVVDSYIKNVLKK